MKFSAGKVRRKWPFGRLFCDQRAMVTAAALLGASTAAQADIAIPLPQSRPAEAPAATHPAAAPAAAEAAPPAPSACRLALTEAIAIAPSIPPIAGPGGCGGDDLVRLEAVVLPDGNRAAVKPAAILRCPMASAVADWIRTDMTPLAQKLGSRVSELDNFDSYECRGRNRVAGAKLSEHGRANALDVRALKLANGQTIDLTDRSVAHDLRQEVLGSVCARFTTVLGPGSDGYHENHIHLDLIQRRNGYRICHWEIYDPLPVAAPVLPLPRPEQAPPPRDANVAVNSPTATEPAPPLEKPASEASVPRPPSPAQPATPPAAASGQEHPRAAAVPTPLSVAPSTPVLLPRPRPPEADGVVASARSPVRRTKRRIRRRQPDLPPFLRQLFN